MMNSLQPSELHQPTFSEGFNASLKAIVYILQHPILLFYTFLALLINGAIIGLLLWWGWDRSDLILPLLKQYAFLKSIFLLLKFVLLIVIIYFVVPILFASLLNLNPIAAFLASEMFKIVFKNETGQAFVEVDSFFVGLPKMLWAELRKLIAPLILMILAFSLHLVPVIGSIASMIAFFLIGIQFAGWSYVTPYYESLGYGFKKQRIAMRRQRFGIWGVGMISMIPILNILALFIGPVGGALVMAKAHQRSLENNNSQTEI